MKYLRVDWISVRGIARYLSLFSFLGLFFLAPSSANANQEECRIFDYNKTFYFGYTPEWPTWTRPGTTKVITWAVMDSGQLNDKEIVRNFGSPHIEWLREAFQSWDDALDSITFKQEPSNSNAEIKIAWTKIQQLDYESLFSVRPVDGLKAAATIEFKHFSPFLIKKENFLQAAQSDIGHILGMGYIRPSSELVSVMEWPFEAPYGQMPLSEFDISLIRSIYSESTCPSSFSQNIQNALKERAEIQAKVAEELRIKQEQEAQAAADEKARQELYWISIGKALAEAEAKARQEAEAKAKVEAEAKAAAELKAKQEAETAAKVSVVKKRTITCLKGKTVKKVKAVNPKCPKGYKKKKSMMASQ